MNYKHNEKMIRIPDSQIEKIMQGLKVTQEEAIQIYLEDEGIKHNQEQEALCEKAKASRITATIHGARAYEYNKSAQKTQKERVKKANPTKEMVIAEIAKILPQFAENIEIVNAGKLITFSIGENSFKLDLIQNRKKK